MQAIALALAPLFLILMTGKALKKSDFLPTDFWRGLEKLTYWLLLPSLFFRTMANADFSGLSLFPAMFAALLWLAAIMAFFILTRPMLKGWDGASYSSIIQGASRFNNYVGLPVTLSLFGQNGLVVYAIIISALIPLTNVTSVWAISHYASHERLRWRKLTRQIITNPLIVSTLLGIAVNLIFNTGQTGLMPVLHEIVDAFANASLLTGLLAIGASLNLEAVRTDKKRVLYSCAIKLLLAPAIAVGCGMVFSLDALSISVLILFASLPTATSSFILARELGGNATLMANIVATETLLAFATMPIVLWLTMHYFAV